MRWILVAILLGLGLLLGVSFRRGDSLIQWQLTLLATEFGHYLAILALLAGISAFFVEIPPGPVRAGFTIVGVSLAVLLLWPTWQAVGRVEGFSISRLFLPWTGPDTASVSVERHVFREGGEEGGPLELIVCLPPDAREAGARLPWVVSIHGGGWSDGKPDEFLHWDRELASHGFVVVMPAYRLAPEHHWPSQRDDIREAVGWMRTRAEEFGIDPEDLTLLGRSAGGQIASATAFGLPGLGVRRCVAFYAPHDMFFARKYARPDDVLDSLKLLRDYLGGDPEEKREVYHSASAIELVTSEVPPTLLIHGTRDTLVWVKQSRRLAAEMESENAPVTFLELPWATHACDYFPFSPGGQVAMRTTLSFLRRNP